MSSETQIEAHASDLWCLLPGFQWLGFLAWTMFIQGAKPTIVLVQLVSVNVNPYCTALFLQCNRRKSQQIFVLAKQNL